MERGSDYYGFGSKANYVHFFASRGTTVAEIASTLGKSIVQLMAECPTLDFYQYQILPHVPAYHWSNDEIRTLVENFGQHGADWDGWRELLPRKRTSSIRSCAAKLGLFYVGGSD